MYILTNKDNEIIAISKICERIEEYRNIKLDDHNIAYAPDQTINIYEVDTVDKGICEQKYCYTETDGFYINESYVGPKEPIETRMDLIEERVALTEDMINMSLGF